MNSMRPAGAVLSVVLYAVCGACDSANDAAAPTTAESICGNGNTDPGEGCDDGNAETERCPYGVPGCTVCDATCHFSAGATSFCGDGVLDSDDGEICDGGTTDNGDACSSTCRPLGCGDGDLDDDEDCDDGNAVNGDGCDNNCTATACGNGVVSDGEDCDDGNVDTEVCSYGQQACHVCDAGCRETAGETSYCGDGVVDAPREQCDDGDTLDEGACNATCSGEPPYCGDGVVLGGEHCDGAPNCAVDCPIARDCNIDDPLLTGLVLGPADPAAKVYIGDLLSSCTCVSVHAFDAGNDPDCDREDCLGGGLEAELVVRKGFDDNDRITTLRLDIVNASETQSAEHQFGYADAGHINHWVAIGANGQRVRRTFDISGRRLTQDLDRDGDGTFEELESWTFGDGPYAITHEVDGNPYTAADGVIDLRQTWAYDNDGRLLRRDDYGADGGIVRTVLWTRRVDGTLERFEGTENDEIFPELYPGQYVDPIGSSGSDGPYGCQRLIATFDAAERMLSKRCDIDGDGNDEVAELWTYDAQGYPASYSVDGTRYGVPADGLPDRQTRWSYDELGNLLSQYEDTDGDGTDDQWAIWTRDASGALQALSNRGLAISTRPCKEGEVEGDDCQSWGEDLFGLCTFQDLTFDAQERLLVSSCDRYGDGQVVILETFTRDARGEPLTFERDVGYGALPDGLPERRLVWSYDAAGYAYQLEEDSYGGTADGVVDSRTSWTHDAQGKMTAEMQDGGYYAQGAYVLADGQADFVRRWAYDAAGRMTLHEYDGTTDGGTVTADGNVDGRSTWDYDAAGRLVDYSSAYGDGLAWTTIRWWRYSDAGTLSEVGQERRAPNGSSKQTWTYTNQGEPALMTYDDGIDGTFERQRTYLRDNLDRIYRKQVDDDGDGAADFVLSWDYSCSDGG